MKDALKTPTDWCRTFWYNLPSTVRAPGGNTTASPIVNPIRVIAYKDGAFRSTFEWKSMSASLCMLKNLSRSATLIGFKRTMRHMCWVNAVPNERQILIRNVVTRMSEIDETQDWGTVVSTPTRFWSRCLNREKCARATHIAIQSLLGFLLSGNTTHTEGIRQY